MSIENPIIYGTQRDYCWAAFARGYYSFPKAVDDPMFTYFTKWWDELKLDPAPVDDEHALFKKAWMAGAELAFNVFYNDVIRNQPTTT